MKPAVPARKTPETVDDYIRAFPPEVRGILERIRRTIRKAAPGSVETISYRIPGFTLDGRYLMYFAAFKDHISVYPIPPGPPSFEKELRPFVKGKGTIRFPLGQPVPYGLVEKIARHHVKARSAGTRGPSAPKPRAAGPRPAGKSPGGK